jgi:hypothetical protein
MRRAWATIPQMICPQLNSFVALEGASPDVIGPADPSRLANVWFARTSAACRDWVSVGLTGGR